MSRISGIVAIVILVLVSSCGKKLLPTSSIEKEYGLERFDFEYLQTKSKIKFASEDKSLSSSATIRMKKDSIIWVSLSPILGIEAARGFINQDTIVFLDRVNKEVYRYNYESLSNMLNFEVDFQMVQSILLGNQVFEFTKDDEYDKKGNLLKIDQRRDRFLIQTIANKDIRKVKNVMVKELPDGNDMSMVFDNFNQISNQAFPFKSLVTVLSKAKNGTATTTIEINHSKVDIGANPISFPFSVSSKYD
ncbi:DUF4292 domain-containing protein [Marivirga sp. S37H4]|uniref:DUF4292 domain-containing protein n=1 Tax=Marivirga aurantiaca TaxID=2802615 RepID=A0A934WYD2_9BACT|nr:DUF4292 domain-containing protein [Marivirga aurantiaca]MBK6265176.1 DUF4292 domain-containing protein [Marivirga aurantiaca]